MSTKNLPLKYIFRRLFQLGSPYKTHIFMGAICLSIMAACMGSSLTLIKPLFNIASQSENAGLHSFLIIKEYTDPFPAIQDYGKKIANQLPLSMQLTPVYKNYVLLSIIACGILLSVLITIFQYLAYYITHHVSLNALTDVRSALNDVLIRQQLAYYDQYKPGELMSKIQNDTETMSRALIFVYNQAPRGIIVILVGLVMASIQFPTLMIGLLLLPLFIIPLKKLGKKIKRSSKKTLEKRAELTDVMHQQFGGIQEIKGYNLEDTKQQLFADTNTSVLQGLMGIVKARAKSRGVVEGGGYLAVLIVVIGAIFLMRSNPDGSNTMGNFTGFMALIGFLIWTPLRTLSKAYNDFQNALPGVQSVLDILDHPQRTVEKDICQAFPDKIESIVFEKVSYNYHKGPRVLDDVSFSANNGQVIAFVGHTGSGKSTIATLIPRFRDPVVGQICINGINLKNFSLNELRDNIALVNQDPYLFNTSVKDNLLMGKPSASEEELWQALEKSQLHDFIKDKKEGLGYVVGERGNNLSGGQKQRLAIARAILKDSPILILDEATSSQDNVTEQQIQKALSTLMQGRTTFVIAHRLTTIHHADLLLIFKEGKIVEQGTHDSLKDAGGEYASLYQTQFNN